MTDILRPGFPLRMSNDLYSKKEDEEEEEFLLKWRAHNIQVLNMFHQLCQVLLSFQDFSCFEERFFIAGGTSN